MTYKLQIMCPDDPEVVEKIIDAACRAGAGIMGNYSHTAFTHRGQGQWKPLAGAHPAIGMVGEMSRVPEVKIEMHCPESSAKAVKAAVIAVHPYEEPAIEFIRLEEV